MSNDNLYNTDVGLHRVVLCLGSNVVDRKQHIDKALDMLRRYIAPGYRMSHAYMTPSHSGFGDAYLNVVMMARTPLDPDALHDHIKDIEFASGRTEKSKSEGRVPLDIDIVVYDGIILRPFDFSARHFQLGYRQLVGDSFCPIADNHPDDQKK